MSLARSARIGPLAALAFAATFVLPLRAQCEADWQDGAPAPGPKGTVNALLPLLNGDVFAGGVFRIADGAIVNNTAIWDGATWKALGSGPGMQVRCALQRPNGDILVGGGDPYDNIRKWDGTTWSSPAPGLGGTVNCLLVLPSGDLIAGGMLVLAGTTQPFSVAIWNGTTWSALGTNLPPGNIQALTRLANGDVVAAGSFATFPAQALERWNGTTWRPITGFDHPAQTIVEDAVVRPNGDLVFAGTFRIQGVDAGLATWDGEKMRPVTTPVSSPRRLLAAANGDVVVSGTGPLNNLARWNGASWQTIVGFNATPEHICEGAAGHLIVSHHLTTAFQLWHLVRRFDGTAWHNLGAQPPPQILAMALLPNGDVIAGGSFTALEGVPATNIARWNGVTWSPLGLGVDRHVTALAVAPNGDVIAAGWFVSAGGAPANHVARWNGVAWSPLGTGVTLPPLTSTIQAVGVAGNGDVLLALPGGGVTRFDGLQWTPVAFPGVFAFVNSMVTRSNGDVVLVGLFDGFVAGFTGAVLLNGSTPSAITGAPSSAWGAVLADDDSVIISSATLQRWDGQVWTPLPAMPSAAQVKGLAQLPNGELVTCGAPVSFGGAPASCLHRLRASGWESWGSLTAGNGTCVVATPRGEVLVGGTFETAGAVVCYGHARSSPTCPASNVVVGAGCSGGAGPVTLAADNGAWVGGTLRATAQGMTPNSLAIQVVGLQPATQPLPGGAVGCQLFTQPILTDLLLPSGGLAAAALAIPNQLALAGLQFQLQVVGIELGGAGIVLTSTNALQVTIGAL